MRTPRALLAAGLLALALLATGCDPGPGGTEVTAGCAPDGGPPSGAPGQAPVLATFGMTTTPRSTGYAGSIIVYADGWAAVAEETAEFGRGRMMPPPQEPDRLIWRGAYLSGCELAILRERLVPVLGDGTRDWGDPWITDVGSVGFEYHLDGAVVSASIHALGLEEDGVAGLDRGQIEARRAVSALWEQVRGALTPSEPIPVTRLRVTWDWQMPIGWPVTLTESAVRCADVSNPSEELMDYLRTTGTREQARVVIVPSGVAGCAA